MNTAPRNLHCGWERHFPSFDGVEGASDEALWQIFETKEVYEFSICTNGDYHPVAEGANGSWMASLTRQNLDERSKRRRPLYRKS